MQNFINRMGWVLAGALGLLVIAAVTGVVHGGPLDPPGPPASTMHTLDDTAPVWDQTLNSTNGAPAGLLGQTPAGCDSDRFKCVMTYQQCASFCITIWPAVLDRETGLVWERAPSTSTASYHFASSACGDATTGRKGGWRLPTTAELMSIRDQSVTTDPQLPAGNPFDMSLTFVGWWTSTLEFDANDNTPRVGIAPFYPGGQVTSAPLGGPWHYWCVRGAT